MLVIPPNDVRPPDHSKRQARIHDIHPCPPDPACIHPCWPRYPSSHGRNNLEVGLDERPPLPLGWPPNLRKVAENLRLRGIGWKNPCTNIDVKWIFFFLGYLRVWAEDIQSLNWCSNKRHGSLCWWCWWWWSWCFGKNFWLGRLTWIILFWTKFRSWFFALFLLVCCISRMAMWGF